MVDEYTEEIISQLEEIVKKRKAEENRVEQILGEIFRKLIEGIPKT